MTYKHFKPRMAVAVCASAVLAMAAGCGRPPHRAARRALPTKQEATVQRALNRVVAAGAPGAIVLVRDGARTLRLTSGYANLEASTPMRAADRFRIGSVTKSFVAAVVLELVGEGKLRLDDPVERWLPGLVPNGKRITVRELLNHTSGIFDYASDKGFLARVIWKRRETWSPRQLVRIATAHPPTFAPGKGWSYSNTGYVLLGMIAEAASRNSISTELDRRIFGPLHLEHTSFDQSPHIAGTFAHGYADPSALNLPLDQSRPEDVSVFSQSSIWAAGAIVSTADDLANFYRALLRGGLLHPALLRAMETTVRVPVDPSGGGDGLGLFQTRLRCGPVFGHEGTAYGYKTIAYSSRAARRQVVVMANDSPPSDRLANALARLVETAYCGS
jgi:D-alanyl-D-alanine carboxypeptidase